MRVVTFFINKRCPLRCRHCSEGFSETYHGTSYKIDGAQLERSIEDIDPSIYGMAVFAGGEPALDPALVKIGIETCKRVGIESAMVTSPFWAAKEAAAQRLLGQVAGLTRLILSYDYYHLEFLTFQHYENAVREANKLGIKVSLYLTYSNERERQRLLTSIEPIRSQLVNVGDTHILPVGNAAKLPGAEFDMITINSVADLDLIPRKCVLGNPLVEADFSIHGCCWSCLGEQTPFYYPSKNQLKDTLRSMEDSPLFQSINRNGFLGALSDEGKQALVERVKGRSFCSECDICVAAMKSDAGKVWQSCVPPASLQTEEEPAFASLVSTS